MIGRSISVRYAKVLFDLDRVKGNFDQRLKDFEKIAGIFGENPKLVRFLKAPQVSLMDKKKLLQDSLKENFDVTFINFLAYLIQKGRLPNIGQIGKEYTLLVNKHLGRWEADIVTAVPMDVESKTKLTKKLENMFHKKINLKEKIDPAIIGGAILVISNEMLDWSVAGRLKKLKENLIATQV